MTTVLECLDERTVLNGSKGGPILNIKTCDPEETTDSGQISASFSATTSLGEISDTTPEDINSRLVSDNDPACIVGIACRLPGDIRSPSDLWALLTERKATQGRVPTERFNIAGYYNPDGKRAGVMDADGGYFLNEDVRKFDNSFFGINNLEATYMDPQQRKLLEITYECLESAGASMEDVSGSNTAVYVGNFTVDYQTMQTRDPDYLHRYSATGSGTAIMANRISHVFNLHGPSFTLDTACSSSIYALHNAITALHSGDCSAAIVAAANLITSIEQHLGTMKGGVLSPTSTCHTFDASADGYGRGEAVSVVYIKRLSQALRDNNPAPSSAVAQPSARLQEAVIRKAYASGGLSFADTDYVECHGTGTAVGDPVEVEAIGRCFANREGPPLILGAIKTNIGHSGAASGLSAVIKAVLAFENGKIPPTFGVKKLNPKLRLDELNLKVTSEVEDWPRALRRASINSFGYGGANAHLILEAIDSYIQDYTSTEQPPNSLASKPSFLIPISAKSKWSLERQITKVSARLEEATDNELPRIAFSLAERRAHFDRRAAILVNRGADNAKTQVDVVTASSAAEHPLPIGFIFTGQGAQYTGMAKELLVHSASFRASIASADSILQALTPDLRPPWTLEQILMDITGTSNIDNPSRSQPVCTAVQIALVDLLEEWGVCPDAVVGHSSGEIAAAYAAGGLTASEAILVAYLRGVAVGKLKGQGDMLAAGIDADSANKMIEEEGLVGCVCVACVNAPRSVTLSGEVDAIDKLKTSLEKTGSFARKLNTGNRAYHSHMMADISDIYEQMLKTALDGNDSVRERPPGKRNIKMYSSVGRSAEDLAVLDGSSRIPARYWRDNLESTVQFHAALTNLISHAQMHLIEIGPHAALKGPIEQIRKNIVTSHRYSPTLLRGGNADACLKKLAADLYINGHTLIWSNINPNGGCKVPLVNLPSYPWDYTHDVLWSEPRPSVEQRNRKRLRHELLGALQLAGNGIDWTWRNVLRLSEVPWIQDHRLESQIVFPATGYLGLVMEAMCQLRDANSSAPGGTFVFRNVNIINALVLRENIKDTEIHTSLSARKLSTAASSSRWFDFSVSSWEAGESTIHCAGSVCLKDETLSRHGHISVQNIGGFETWAMDRWYKKLAQEGLCFGPQFRSITSLSTDSSRLRSEAISTTKLFQSVGKSATTVYPVHPLVLDACLQAGIFGGTAGDLSALRAFLPVFLGSCKVRPLAQDSATADPEATIHTRTRITGFATKKIDCTLRDSSGQALVDMTDVRLSLFASRTTQGAEEVGFQAEKEALQRQPCLRVCWKPDITKFDSDLTKGIRSYLDQAILTFPPDLVDHPSMAVILALIDLASFKNPGIRVLELETRSECRAKRWLHAIEENFPFPRYGSWSGGEVNTDGNLITQDGVTGVFDALIIPGLIASTDYMEHFATQLDPLVNPQGGVIITRKTAVAEKALCAAGFSLVDSRHNVLLAARPVPTKSLADRDATIIIRTREASQRVQNLGHEISGYLQRNALFRNVAMVALDEIPKSGTSPESIYISLLEIENEFLATMGETDMNLLRRITDTATDLVWLTGADMVGPKPDANLTLSSGLARALMLEQPSLRFTILDLGSIIDRLQDGDLVKTACANLTRALVPLHNMDDTEFIQKGSLINISRFVADSELNALFRRRLDPREPVSLMPLSQVGPARLAIGSIGQTDTLHFVQDNDHPTPPPPGFADIRTKAVSLNAKDIYTASGRVETRTGTAAIEFSGVVVAVGEGVTHIAPGDHAVVLAPNRFSTIERVPAWAAHKMLPSEEFHVMPTLPVAFGTALYALQDRAHLRRGESILVHSGAGAFGMATIMLAQRLGAVVYATVGTEAKKEYLTKELGVLPERIFNSRDSSSFVEGIRQATNGHGVDVVINSLVGDLMHDSWDCIADFGRFVEVGKRELVDAGKLDMSVFLRNCTFTAFDLTELFYHPNQFYRDIWINKTKQALELYRDGQVKPVPITVFDVSEIAKGYRHFSARDRIGKVVISMEKPESRVQVMPSRYKTFFSSTKVYLLVGCLGGLGRSLSRWMMARGARHFVFVGRSGCDKPEARGLVERLHGAGATVTVVRGDVSNAADVDTAVETCVATGRPIGGVVQAAMGLHEALFCTMPNSAWQTGIRPKWQGSWNLHKSLSLEGRDTQLDFFLLTSSVSGSVGTATESNYCAANAFLDAFAYWRRSQGKPAVSVGFGMISEVGYLHENPEIEALLLRKGIQALNEDEFLQVVDMALTPATNERPAYGPATSHILTGLEPFGLRELIKRGFDVENGTTQGPRCAFLAAALAADQRENGKSTTASDAVAAASWYKVVPTGATGALAAEADAPTLFEAVLRLVRKRFSSLILMPLDQIDDRRPLTQFGVDSMIAAEFRTWFWSAFKVDIPFLDIMSPKKALDTLSAYVEEKLIAQSKVVPSE